jgi:hypothetical protein
MNHPSVSVTILCLLCISVTLSPLHNSPSSLLVVSGTASAAGDTTVVLVASHTTCLYTGPWRDTVGETVRETVRETQWETQRERQWEKR